MLELYREYNQLNKATQQLSVNDKQQLVGLTMMSEWQSFIKMLDNWKYQIVTRGLQFGKDKDDLISMQAQVRNIAVLKTFQNKHKNAYNKPIENTEDDPTTVPL
uniref:Uncharacterized protein n=1 Tax=viral metagenome TaxID=1070528 RepID=A0A6H1ZR04_9ZZZZ